MILESALKQSEQRDWEGVYSQSKSDDGVSANGGDCGGSHIVFAEPAVIL